MKKSKKILTLLLCGIMTLASTAPPALAVTAETASKAQIDISVDDSGYMAYREYLQQHQKAAKGTADIALDLSNASSVDQSFQQTEKEDGSIALYTAGFGTVDFKFQAPEAGFYHIKIEFMAESERGSEIERDILINGEIPFKEAKGVEFNRTYCNETAANGVKEFQKDEKGDDVRPSQLETKVWQTVLLRDSLGYQQEPLLFYFEKGENTLSFKSVAEPLSICGITLAAPVELPSYEQVASEYQAKGYALANAPVIYLQGEHADIKSSPTLFPINDATSPQTVPYEKGKSRLNAIGGYRWQDPGDFMTWKVEIEKAGLYTIAIKSRQNVTRDTKSTRAVYIDNEIPFQEFAKQHFEYSSKWQQRVLGNGTEEFQIYLEKGTHEVKIESLLGDTAAKIQEVENILRELNEIYTTILMITGSSPDLMRDYSLDLLVPDEIARMGELAEELAAVSDWFYQYSGKKGSNTAILDTMTRVLKLMSSDHEKIPKNFSAFKTNIGSLANWIVTSKQQPLEIDYIALCSDDSELPEPNAGFFSQLWYDIQRFIGSFFNNKEKEQETKTIDVWLGTGRDQAQVLKKMIDSDFSKKKNIDVNLKLVTASVFLPATVAGIGPDVALNMADSEPVNYAIRDAVYDLTQFEDYTKVSERFMKERMVPLSFDSHVYALPETQSFNVLFYRKDVLSQLNLKVPDTWEELFATIPVLMKNNLSFAMPVSTVAAPAAGVNSYFTLLFQRGGQIYENGGMRMAIDSNKGIAAFKDWTNLYENYGLPLSYDFQNRFRTGEYPLAIADFTSFNNLVVAAPEIDGLWSFAPLPGTKQEDGTIDRSTPLGGTCTMLLAQSDNKEEAWEFMKWWTDADAQTTYGKEMESILGASARYATANIAAFKQMPWKEEHYKVLDEQLQWTKGVEQVPGGYFTSRHLDNAFRKVVNEAADPKETLYDYTYTINQELIGKRKEFGLPTEQFD